MGLKYLYFMLILVMVSEALGFQTMQDCMPPEIPGDLSWHTTLGKGDPPTTIGEIVKVLEKQSSNQGIKLALDTIKVALPMIQDTTITNYDELLTVKKSIRYLRNTATKKRGDADFIETYDAILGEVYKYAIYWYGDLSNRTQEFQELVKLLPDNYSDDLAAFDNDTLSAALDNLYDITSKKRKFSQLQECWSALLREHKNDLQKKSLYTSSQNYLILINQAQLKFEALLDAGEKLKAEGRRRAINKTIYTVIALIPLSILVFYCKKLRKVLGFDEGEKEKPKDKNIEDDKKNQGTPKNVDSPTPDDPSDFQKEFDKYKSVTNQLRERSKQVKVLSDEIGALDKRVSNLEILTGKLQTLELLLEENTSRSRYSISKTEVAEIDGKDNTKESNKTKLYLKAPNQEGEFSKQTVPQDSSDAYYVLSIDNEQASQGNLSLNESNREAMKRLTARLDLWLTPVCDIENPEDEETRDPKTIEAGVARLQGDKWVVNEHEKVKMRYRII